MPSRASCLFEFTPAVPTDEAVGTFQLALLATESLYGPDRVALEAVYKVDPDARTIEVDRSNSVGGTLALVFLGYLRREFGAAAFRTRSEPTPGPGVPRCPGWLDDQAKHAWRQLVLHLVAMRVLTGVDRNALARYCVLWSRWKAAELFLQKHGSVFTLKDEAGAVRCVQQFPQVAIAHRLALALSRLEAEFGMTPSGRARIQALPEAAARSPEEDEFERFLRMAQ